MTRQLATMVSSGMSILRALYVLEAQTENEKLAGRVVAVRKDVEAGLPLSDALERHPKVFSRLFVAMTRAGETGGMLDGALLRVADQLEKEDVAAPADQVGDGLPGGRHERGLHRPVRPRDLPGPGLRRGSSRSSAASCRRSPRSPSACRTSARATSGPSRCSPSAPSYAFRRWKAIRQGPPRSGTASACGSRSRSATIVQKVALARWSRTFSALISAGVPLLQALEITGKTAGNRVIEQAMDDVRRVGQAGRHDRRAAASDVRDLPDHGQPHGRRGRGDRRPRHRC